MKKILILLAFLICDVSYAQKKVVNTTREITYHNANGFLIKTEQLFQKDSSYITASGRNFTKQIRIIETKTVDELPKDLLHLSSEEYAKLFTEEGIVIPLSMGFDWHLIYYESKYYFDPNFLRIEVIKQENIFLTKTWNITFIAILVCIVGFLYFRRKAYAGYKNL